MRQLLFACLLFSSQLPAQLGKDLGSPSQYRGVKDSDAQVNAALKEALSIASTNAVRMNGAENGFWSNGAIKITMPDAMRTLELDLRRAGQGLRINDFELAMNRAAEMATASAGPLLANAIGGLKFTDARVVLNGGRAAGTEYLAVSAAQDLLKALRPTVEAAMRRTGVNPIYNALFAQMQGLTLGQSPVIDIGAYVTRKTLDGLFITMGAEENKIRNDPEAPVTPLVKEVFTKR